jgi:hypothetical protein
MKRSTTVYLEDSQLAALAAMSKRTMAPVAAIIRAAIDEWLKRNKASKRNARDARDARTLTATAAITKRNVS